MVKYILKSLCFYIYTLFLYVRPFFTIMHKRVNRFTLNSMKTFYETLTSRNSHQRCSIKRLFLKISQYSQQNTYVRVCNFIKKRLQHRCFPVSDPKFLRTHILTIIWPPALYAALYFT